jgi:adenylate kinase
LWISWLWYVSHFFADPFPPILGKGTCGEIISQRLGIAHVSTGDLFRREVALQTPAGLEIASYMSKGQFVPPELANSILADRLSQPDAQRGVLLDGFPRSIEHLLDLDQILKPSNRQVEAAILLDLDEQICLNRLSGRRHCPQCLQSYNIHSPTPPPRDLNSSHWQCERCGGVELIQRADDSEEIIKKRFELSKSSLIPLLEELKRRDILYTLKISSGDADTSGGPSSKPADISPTLVANKIIEIMAYPERFHQPQHLTACYRLSLHLFQSLFLPRSEEKEEQERQETKTLCLAFRDQSLLENVSKRTGLMRRFVYLSSDNPQKYQEFVRVFDRYGIEVLQLPSLPEDISHWSPEMIQFARTLLSCRSESLVPLAILRETSVLLKPGTSSLLAGNEISQTFALDGIPSPPFGASQLLSNPSFRSTGRAGVLANHFSLLTSIWLPVTGPNSHKLCGKYYSHLTQGRLRDSSPSSGLALNPLVNGHTSIHRFPVFGWDDEFILLETNESYHRHREKGLKISSRDMVLSLFLQDRIYYKHPLNLNHSPLPLTRAVDFSIDVATFIESQEFYQTPHARLFGLQNLLVHVLNEGIFFKGADTRLEANYWQPGLNAGLPLIGKRDPIHETTFMFHDFGHFTMKDLIYTGVNTPLHRHVYIIHRMMSEAITIMMADGLFVESLSRSQVADYDFTTRKIYPLFRSLWGESSVLPDEGQNLFPIFGENGLPLHRNKEKFIARLKAILKASVDFTVKGDDRSFKALLRKHNTTDDTLISAYETLSEYKRKYKPFFVSDFNWTVHNYENMSNRSNEMRRWWELTSPVREMLDLPLETIDEFIQQLSEENRTMETRMSHQADFISGETHIIDPIDGEEYLPTAHPLAALIDNVFEIIFTRNIEPIFQQMDAPEPLPLAHKDVRLKRGFYRYLIGQMGLFARFWTIPETRTHLNELIHLIQRDHSTGTSIETSIVTTRLFYESFLELLLKKNLLSKDDCHNFKDIYPLFEPFYVTYDDHIDAYPHLQHLSHALLSSEKSQEFQKKQIEKILQRKVTKREMKYCVRMRTLVEAAGGSVDEGIFVTQPGIVLLAHTAFQSTQSVGGEMVCVEEDGNIPHATFLLAGISLETSLEFIAHHEATVARLTSSKTMAMNVPFYRLQETGGGGETSPSEEGGGEMAMRMLSYLKLQQSVRTQYEIEEKPYESWGSHGVELFNLTAPGCKCTAMVYTMALRDYHKLFIGRMGESGNEYEVRAVVKRMAEILHPLSPNLILTPERYLSLSNGEKYQPPPPPSVQSPSSSSCSSSVPCCLVAETALTSEAVKIFQSLHVDLSASPFEQLAEFSSRITYLAFLDHPPPAHSSREYLAKMIHEFQHRSIVSSIRLSYLLLLDESTMRGRETSEMVFQSVWKVGGTMTVSGGKEGEGRRAVVVTVSLKSLHALFKEWGQAVLPQNDDAIRTMMEHAHERYTFAIDPLASYCSSCSR